MKKNWEARKKFAQMGKVKQSVTYNRMTECVDPDWKFEEKRLTQDENMMVTWIVIMADSMQKGMERILRERLEMIPQGHARFAEVARQLLGIGDDLLYTMTPSQLVTMNDKILHGTITITQKEASATPNLTAVVRCNEMQTIAKAAQEGECALCVRTGGEIRGCALRKAFDGCGLCPKQYDEGLGCIYRDMKIDLNAPIIE